MCLFFTKDTIRVEKSVDVTVEDLKNLRKIDELKCPGLLDEAVVLLMDIAKDFKERFNKNPMVSSFCYVSDIRGEETVEEAGFKKIVKNPEIQYVDTLTGAKRKPL